MLGPNTQVGIGIGIGAPGAPGTPGTPGTPGSPGTPGLPGALSNLSDAQLAAFRKQCVSITASPASYDRDLVAMCRLLVQVKGGARTAGR